MVVPVQIPKPLNEESLDVKETVESIAQVEIQPPTTQQTIASDQIEQPQAQKQVQTRPTQKSILNVVVKNQGKVRLHPLKSPDTLTTIADKEEEEFISEVEAVHDEHL